MAAPLASGLSDSQLPRHGPARVARLGFAAGLLLAPTVPAYASDVRVSVTGAGIEVVATAAPVSEILDRLARQTGMKLVYEGPTPRQVVTLAVKRSSVSDVVLAVIEGLGINFALAGGTSGMQTLLVTGVGAPVQTPFAPSLPVTRPDSRILSDEADLLDPGNGASDDAAEMPEEMASSAGPPNRGPTGPAPGVPTTTPVPGASTHTSAATGWPPPAMPQPLILPPFQPQPLTFPTPAPPGQPQPGPNPAASRPPLADANPQP